MEGLLLFAMLLQGAFCWVAFGKLLQQVQAKHGEDSTRLAMLAKEAMETMLSKSIQEKVRTEAMRKEYDVRLEMFRDTVAKDSAIQAKKKPTTPDEPQYITTDDGQQIKMSDVEWFDS